MNAGLKIFVASLLITLSFGCASQRSAVKSTDRKIGSKALFSQAQQVLADHQFIIKITEVFSPSGNLVTNSPLGSYISMQGSHATISITSNLSPDATLGNLNIEDASAEITTGELKKNGDIVYQLQIHHDANVKNRKAEIRLYKDTNKCYVQLSNGVFGYAIADFKGQIYPSQE